MNRTIVASDPEHGQRILITLFPGGGAQVALRGTHDRVWGPPLEITEDNGQSSLDAVRAEIFAIAKNAARFAEEARREADIEQQEDAIDMLNDSTLPPYRPDAA